MAINIKRILNKKNPTGEEVGKALIANTAAGYERLLRTRDYAIEPKGLFGQAEMDRMISCLKTDNDISTYNAYVNINNYIAKEQGFASAYQQQANLGYYKLFQELNTALAAEDRIADSVRGPLIMTRKQYNYYRNEVLAEERKYTLTYFGFLRDIFSFYYDQYKKHPRKKNPLSSAIKISASKFIKNERILCEYVEMWGLGHYITNSGIRSDKCCQEEWEDIVDKTIYGENTPDSIANIIIDSNMSALRIENCINVLKRGSRIYLDKTIPEIDDNFTWLYDDAPEQLEGSEILEHLIDYYVYLFVYPYRQEKTESQLKEFESDFPELYEALKKEAAKLLPSAKSFSMKDFDKPIVTFGELESADILDYKHNVNTIYSHQIIQHISSHKSSTQVAFHGIAIMREEDLDEYNVDEKGYYIQPDLSIYALKGEVRNLASDNYCPSFIKSVREEELIASMREVYAFNTVIDLISEITGVDVSVFSMKTQTEAFEHQVTAFNNMILTLYNRIVSNNAIFDEEEGKERLLKARELFPMIDLKKAQPTPSAIAKTKDYISDLHAFKVNTPIIIEMLKEQEED